MKKIRTKRDKVVNCKTKRLTGSAEQRSTKEPTSGRTPEPVITQGSFTPKLWK